jgi:hypothetical protein
MHKQELAMTQDQKHTLAFFRNKLMEAASKKGPMHANWDIIFDLESLLKGEPTVLKMSTDEWIDYCRCLVGNPNEST